MEDFIELLEKDVGWIALSIVALLLIVKVCKKQRVNFKCGWFTIDCRKAETKQKQIESESQIQIRNMKLEEMKLRIQEKEIELQLIKSKKDETNNVMTIDLENCLDNNKQSTTEENQNEQDK